MKIAVPTLEKKLCSHFGHCQNFAIMEIENNEIIKTEYVDPPAHQPGVYPRFLAEQGVEVVIAGGMGSKAQNLFAQNGIEVKVGVSSSTPEELAYQYLEDSLSTGQNMCDH